MKKLIFIIPLALMSCYGICQELEQKSESRSKTEEFYSKEGSLFEKEFIPVGIVGPSFSIRVMKITDLITEETQSGIRLQYLHKGKYSNSTKSATIDSDELDGFIKSIKILKEKVFISMPSNYKEVTFISRSGFQAGCFWSSVKKEWKTYVKLEKYDSDSYVWLKISDFDELLLYLEKAKTML
ncbi:MAG: hypothetical protein JEY96_01485 [Bacteroidales bacterium]|nr:hypothetical protein [Bacteroidales bacterium]